MIRFIYRSLGIWWAVKALRKGPTAFVKQRVRAKLIGKFARFLRRVLR